MTKAEYRFDPVEIDAFGAEFASFQRTAFRAEFLDVYTVDEEREQFAAFRAGAPPPPSPAAEDEPWLHTIRSAISRGKTFERVHIIAGQATDYLKYEIIWGYRFSAAAGEIVRVRRGLNDLRTAEATPALKDFWLFDDERCYLMDYDLLGRWLGVFRVHGTDVPFYVTLKRELVSESVVLDRFDGRLPWE